MKLYTLTPHEGAPIIDVLDDVETNGKLVLPMVEGDFLLSVKTITTDEARTFRKAKANLEAFDAVKAVPIETLPAAAVESEVKDSDGGTADDTLGTADPAAEAGTTMPEAEAQPQA